MERKGFTMVSVVLVGVYVTVGAVQSLGDDPGADELLSEIGNTPAVRADATSTAADHIERRAWGAVATGPIAGHDRSPAVFIGDAIPDWRPAVPDEVVASIQLLRNRPDCTMPGPAPQARVVNLLVEHPQTRAGMWSYSEADVLRGVRRWLALLRSDPAAPVPGPVASHAFRVHDIAVTETAQPVHLVLQNLGGGNLLYNLHLAPGARISGVSMLGGDANAVAQLDPLVPVAVMDRDTLAGCDLVQTTAARAEAETAVLIESRALQGDAARAAQDAAAARVETYNDWFADQFGVRSDDTLAGLSFAEVSLVGPVPDDPSKNDVRYTTLAGAHVTAQTEAYFKVVGHHDWPGAFKADLRAMATVLANGDPAHRASPVALLTE